MNEQIQGHLNKIVIRGFKSIKECEVDLKNINVLIGANGAGKSNFISIFEMLQRILSRELALYAGKKGISPLLYNGKEVSDSISAEFHFDTFQYSYDLEWTEYDSLLFRGESLVFNHNSKELLGESNHRESNALNTLRKNETKEEIPQIMLNPSWRVYQFHDTSPSSKIKSENNVSNSVHLISDARNLAAFLYRLKLVFPKGYSDILHSTQLVAPFFDDFVLEPKELNKEQIILKWKKKGCDDIFNASQLSDGTLRFICLATLLLQPSELQPDVIIIDEPELGLHPFALTIFSEMLHKAAVEKQVILATQSAELLNYFTADDVIVVDYDKDGSRFERKSIEQLAYWFENDYTLSELWNNNILGGRFAR
ncbi:MAG: AAA family ATPase [Oscillospiraceae bacterium]|jgi:predicted ATPase|nr:AAA family ATPase [Oscillospiraceae bacterium]